MPLKDWFKNKNNSGIKINSQKRSVPDGIWSRCAACNEVIYQKELMDNLKVCPKCDFHFQLTAQERLSLLLDEGSFTEFNSHLQSIDPLQFNASKSYQESLLDAQETTGLNEAVVTGRGKLEKKEVATAVMDFRFIGGSMGSVVGERITRTIEYATSENLPLIIVSCSGGARMQEGILSLMQMAKTSAALAKFLQMGQPYISILTNPTTGGVIASFASLADIIIAEPKALIGFAGPRVIEKTIKQKLPKDFQSAEFMLEHGLVDLVVPRKMLKQTVSQLLEFLSKD